MAYSKDFRECVVKNIKEGKTWKEVLEIFKISRQTLCKWLRMEKTGDLSDKARKEYKVRKIATDKLRELVANHADWTLNQYAEKFNCSYQAVALRLKKLGITHKKRNMFTKRETKMTEFPTLLVSK